MPQIQAKIYQRSFEIVKDSTFELFLANPPHKKFRQRSNFFLAISFEGVENLETNKSNIHPSKKIFYFACLISVRFTKKILKML